MRIDTDQAPRFEVRVLAHDTTVGIAPCGELDLLTVPRVQERVVDLLAQGMDALVFDLTHVSFIDSTAIHMLISLDELATYRGFTLVLLPGPPAVQRVFQIAGVMDLLPFEGIAETV